MSLQSFISPKQMYSRIATQQEMEKYTKKIDFQKKEYHRAGGINVISDGYTSYVDDTENSTIVVGATRSGKTRKVILPYIFSCIKAGYSLIVHDPKTEVYKNIYQYAKKMGYRIRILNFRDPTVGNRANPLERPAKLYQEGNKDRATDMFKNIATTLFTSVESSKDPFWHKVSASYFAGLCALCCELHPYKEVTIDNVYNLHLQGDGKFGGSTYLKAYFDNDQLSPIWKRLYSTVGAPNETKMSIHAVFTSVLDPFIQNRAILDMTLHSTFQVEELVDEPTVLFIITRDEGSSYDTLISAVIEDLYQNLIDLAEAGNGVLKRRIEFVLDEFSNLTKIQNMERKVSISGSRGIRWLLGIQSLKQLSLIYGSETAGVIIGNCNNLVYLFTQDADLLSLISKLCGNTVDEYTGKERSLLPVDQLKHFEKVEGETLMLLDRQFPYIAYLPDISQYCIYSPIEIVKLKKRSFQENNVIDLRTIVKEQKKKQLMKMMDGTKEEKTSAKPENIVKMINKAISEKRG